MNRHIRTALLAGACLILGAGAALAQMEPRPPAPDMYGPGSLHGRVANRILRDFDLNKDGKITKAEVEKILAQRFAEATGGGASMTEAQFEKVHESMLRKHSERMFHRLDWNGDGVLSLEEFRAPLRARFERMDRDATGKVSCAPRRRQSMGPRQMGRGTGGRKDRPKLRHHRHFRGGLTKLCREADLNKDGKVTHSEFDKAVAAKYASVTKSGKAMTFTEFYQLERSRFEDMEARRFKRLDENHDGKLSEAEFAAPALRLFARLDRNNDGVLTKDELRPTHHGRHHRPRRAWDKKPG